MGRRPAHIEAEKRARVPRGQQGFWDLIRELRTFTISQLDGRSNVRRDAIADYVKRLVRAGIVEFTDPLDDAAPAARSPRAKAGLRASPTKVYRLVKDSGPEAPKVRRDGTIAPAGSARENMWRTMKRLGVFTPRELAVAASTATHPVDESDAKSYIRYLRLANYLQQVTTGNPRRQARYRFVAAMNTGPVPPMIQRTHQVFDPNLGRVVWRGDLQGVGGGAT